MMAFNKFKAFRRTAQLMILMRDGCDLKNGATDRRLNVASIVDAAKRDLVYGEYVKLDQAFKASMKDDHDV